MVADEIAPRRAVALGETFEPLPGLKVELFPTPGKVPLWLEEGDVTTDQEGEQTVGAAVEVAGRRLVYAPGCSRVTEALHARIEACHALFFDGTLFEDDEMIRAGLGEKTGRRMGHIACFRRRRIARSPRAAHRRKAHLYPHQQYQSHAYRRVARGAGRRRRGLGNRTRRNGGFAVNAAARSPKDTPMSPEAFEAALRAVGAERYHDLHPFHDLLHDGKLNKGQVQAWALNRYCYQAAIPRKDASLIGRCEDRELRREWIHRLTDHDGSGNDPGGIERWLILTDGLGLDRRVCDFSGRRARGNALRRRGLCAVREGEVASRGGGFQPDRTFRALDFISAESRACSQIIPSSTRRSSPTSAAGWIRRLATRISRSNMSSVTR